MLKIKIIKFKKTGIASREWCHGVVAHNLPKCWLFFKIFFSETLVGKFAIRHSLNNPAYLKHVVSLSVYMYIYVGCILSVLCSILFVVCDCYCRLHCGRLVKSSRARRMLLSRIRNIRRYLTFFCRSSRLNRHQASDGRYLFFSFSLYSSLSLGC